MTLLPLSLRGKLFLFAALLILVPGILLSWLADRSARESLQRLIGGQLAREAIYTAERLSALLQRERETLASFARQGLMREIRVGDIDKRVSRALATLREGSPSRLGYFVLDAEGRVVAASGPYWLGAAGEREASSLANAAGQGPRAFAGQPALVLSTAIPDPDGSGGIIGTLVGALDWASVESELEQVRVDLASRDIDPTLLLTNGTEVIARAGGSAAPTAFPDLVAGYHIAEPDGLISGAAALSGPNAEWRLTIVEPLDHALGPARELTRRLTLTTALALAVALVVATLAARRVVRPLSELTGAIRAMGAGKREEAIVPVRSDDEVGLLARSFNEMTSELQETQQHLVEAEKFAFVGELASGVAHEVRTSLGVLRSSAQMLERNLDGAADAHAPELVGMIRDEVDRLGGVVDDLLTLDRPRAMHLEPTRLSRPLQWAVDFVEPRASEAGIDLSVKVAGEASVLCDREALQHVCVNLFVNALEAAEARVQLTIDPPAGGWIAFRIEDDGPGIPEDMWKRIFEPFVTGRDTGVGLGLTFVKRAIHEHGGRIAVHRSEWGGACFEIQLPVNPRSEEEEG